MSFVLTSPTDSASSFVASKALLRKIDTRVYHEKLYTKGETLFKKKEIILYIMSKAHSLKKQYFLGILPSHNLT